MAKRLYVVNTGGANPFTAEAPDATIFVYAGDPPGGVSEAAPPVGGGQASTSVPPVVISTPTPLDPPFGAFAVDDDEMLRQILSEIHPGAASLLLPRSYATREHLFRVLSALDEAEQVDIANITVNLTAHTLDEPHG